MSYCLLIMLKWNNVEKKNVEIYLLKNINNVCKIL